MNSIISNIKEHNSKEEGDNLHEEDGNTNVTFAGLTRGEFFYANRILPYMSLRRIICSNLTKKKIIKESKSQPDSVATGESFYFAK